MLRIKKKERWAACLEGHKEGIVRTGQIRSLSGAVSVEKIAAIQAKIMSKKRSTSRTDLEDHIIALKQRSFVDPDVDVTWDIVSRESVWRARERPFQGYLCSSAVCGSLRRRACAWTVTSPTCRPCGSHIVYQTAYAHCPQQIWPRKIQKEMRGFQIDSMGTYHGLTLKSVTEGMAALQLRLPCTASTEASFSGKTFP